MDFQTFFYLLAGIIYLLYSANKGLKKFRENQPSQSPAREAREDWPENMSGESRPEKKIWPESWPEMPVPEIVQSRPPSFPAVEGEKELYGMAAEGYDSIEYNEISASGISVPEPEPAPDVEDAAPEERFDPRKAFIYSEIINRKYTADF
jgi:hypothetical protein